MVCNLLDEIEKYFSESSTKTFETMADSPIARASSLQIDHIDEGLDRFKKIFFFLNIILLIQIRMVNSQK